MPIAKSCLVCGARTPDGASRCPRHAGRQHAIASPCVSCARPTNVGDFCDRCRRGIEAARSRDREASGDRKHYSGSYKRRAAEVRKLGETGQVPCFLCGRFHRPGDRWSAEHVIEGDPRSPLVPTHLPCNIARENRRRAAARG